MKILILFFVITIIGIRGVSQPDTMIYKKQIENLTDHASMQMYLDTIFKRDTNYRGNEAITLLDLENLISISYYFNAFGYPSEEDFGFVSMAPRSIWIHNSYLGLRRLSFPLILKAFESRQINEARLRSYYLKHLYLERFAEDEINEIALPELFKLLELNTSDVISIEALISYMEERRTFNSQPKKEVVRWYGEELSKWATVNGERKWCTTRGSPVEIITLENCKLYFRKDNVDHSAEPYELMKIGEKKFKFKNRQTDRYFEIDPDGNLLYRDAVEVFDLYKKIEK